MEKYNYYLINGNTLYRQSFRAEFKAEMLTNGEWYPDYENVLYQAKMNDEANEISVDEANKFMNRHCKEEDILNF